MLFNLLDNASSAAAEGSPGNQQAQMWITLGLYALLALAIYFLIFRPQKKKKKAEEEMKNSLEVGDDITTIGGIMGRVVSIKDDDSLVIETASDRSRLRIKKWAISSIDTEKEKPEEKSGEKTDKKKSKKSDEKEDSEK